MTNLPVVRIATAGLVLASSAFFSVQIVGGFFDEVALLKEELQLWETANAADFSDVIEQLDDITESVFVDVNQDDWFAVYVSSLADWEIVSGYKDSDGTLTGEYKPGNNVTIAEALKMASNAAGIDMNNCDATANYPGVDGHWSEVYVRCRTQYGVRVLKADYLADLDRPATRSEVLTMIHDLFEDQVLPLYAEYTDTKDHGFEADIAYASLLEVVGGDTDDDGNPTGTFRPDDPINRAETAKMIYQKVKNQVRSETI